MTFVLHNLYIHTMNKLYLTSLLLVAVSIPKAYADGQHSWEKYFYEVADYVDNSIVMDEEAYEMLCDLEEHPININTASREDLDQLPFLTALQIADICQYLHRHGPMVTLAELQLIPSIDRSRRQLLACFVEIGAPEPRRRPSLKQILQTGDNELMYTHKQPLYQRKGDRNGYLGFRPKHSFRYTFDAGDYMRFGLLGSQDSGEPFFSGKNGLGYDHYAFYLQMRRLGVLENIVAGHFQVQFGMGLVANTGFNLGKTSMLTSMGRTSNVIRPSLSRSAANYMQGIATTLRLTKELKLSAFASYRPLDATLNKDDGTIRTIVTTGYHRTPTEMGKKNNSHAATTGLNLRFARSGFYIGATTLYTHFDRHLHPQTSTLYRRYYPMGNDFINTSIDYGYTGHTFSGSGETAIDKHGAVATLHTVSANLFDGFTLMALHRYYSHKYTSLYANSFSDGGHVRNEQGVFVGLTWQPLYNLLLNTYADYAHSAWARYRISRPSDSFDTMTSVSVTFKGLRLNAHYRLRMKYRDATDKKVIVRHTGHRARLGATYDYGRGWSTTTQADFALTEYHAADYGYMLSQSVNGQWRWLSMGASANYFDTDSYESRLYAYERGPLHSFSFPAFYGQGLRYALMLRADVFNRLMVLAKIGVTNYFDRPSIGSGLQTIDHSSQADIDLQMKWKF